MFASLEQAILARLSLDLTGGELACDRFYPFPMVRRGTPQRRPIGSISLRWLDLASNLARCRIRRHALRAQMLSKLSSPLPERRLG